MKRLMFILPLIFSIAFFACDDDDKKNTIDVEEVSLNKSTLSLAVGETEVLVATILPETASDKTVTWTSSNTAVATVDEEGKVTAVEPGTTSINVETHNNKTAICQITVVPNQSFTITLPETEVALEIGDDYTFAPVIEPADYEVEITYALSTEEFASMYENTLYTSSAGSFTVTVTATGANDEAYSVDCNITISAPAIEDFTMSFDSDEMIVAVNGTRQFRINIKPYGAGAALMVSSSDESIVTVAPNTENYPYFIVTGVSAGTAKILVKEGTLDKTKEIDVTVGNYPTSFAFNVTGFNKVSNTNYTCDAGDSGKIDVTIAPTGTTSNIEYEYNDEEGNPVTFLSIDDEGNVTTTSSGAVWIKIKVDGCDDAGFYFTVND